MLQYDPRKAEASHGVNRMCTAIGLSVETDHLSTVIANLCSVLNNTIYVEYIVVPLQTCVEFEQTAKDHLDGSGYKIQLLQLLRHYCSMCSVAQ